MRRKPAASTPKQIEKLLAKVATKSAADGRKTRRIAAPDDTPITRVEYDSLQTAFEHLNRELFEGLLPNCLIDLQRKARSGGHFSPSRFTNRLGAGTRHEISLNPDHFVSKSDEFIVSILAHEMVHLWQFQNGERPSVGYHDAQWADKMDAIGLTPTSTGGANGKRTGQKMQHLVVKDGPYARAFAKLAAKQWVLNLESTQFKSQPAGKSSKTKFVCECGQAAWGKPTLRIVCEPCGYKMRAVDAKTEPTHRAA